jgi:hypothetical protein
VWQVGERNSHHDLYILACAPAYLLIPPLNSNNDSYILAWSNACAFVKLVTPPLNGRWAAGLQDSSQLGGKQPPQRNNWV